MYEGRWYLSTNQITGTVNTSFGYVWVGRMNIITIFQGFMLHVLPPEQSLALLNAVERFCWAKGINPKISLKEALINDSPPCSSIEIHLHQFIYGAKTASVCNLQIPSIMSIQICIYHRVIKHIHERKSLIFIS
jgi:hypothetical protein